MYKFILLFGLVFINNSAHSINNKIINEKVNNITFNEQISLNIKNDDIFDNQKDDNIPNLTDTAKIILINKMTAKSSILLFKVNEKQIFENLEIEVLKCLHNNLKFNVDDQVYVEISEQKIYDDNKKIFNGWLYSLSPSLNTLEHPVYEVILSECQGNSGMQ